MFSFFKTEHVLDGMMAINMSSSQKNVCPELTFKQHPNSLYLWDFYLTYAIPLIFIKQRKSNDYYHIHKPKCSGYHRFCFLYQRNFLN